jgi:hypothetical protein
MSRLTQASEEVNLFLTVLGALVERGRSFTPNPTTVQTVEAPSAEVKGFLLPKLGFGPLRDQVTRLGEMLRHEPSTWGMVSPSAADNTWVATLKPSLRAYDGIKGADDYVKRLAAAISPARPEAPPVLVSALALPEAIDYLNAIWRLLEKEPLFLISRSESAAKLAFECNGPDEFDSRLTSLYGILCATRVPGMAGNRKPGDLKTYLTKRLPPGGRPRALAAIEDLQDFLSGRAWRHHPDADRGIAAMQRLGVRLPTDDWGLAWRTLQARMVKALSDLREEIEVIAPPAENVRSA